MASTLHQTVDALGFSGGLAPYAMGALYTIPAIVLTAKPTSRYTLMDPQETLRSSYIATETEDNFPFYMEHTSDSARPIARGQPYFVAATLAIAASTGDFFQIGGLRAARKSLEEGFITQEFMDHQVREAFGEGVIGGTIALLGVCVAAPAAAITSYVLLFRMVNLGSSFLTITTAAKISWHKQKELRDNKAPTLHMYGPFLLLFTGTMVAALGSFVQSTVTIGLAGLGLALPGIAVLTSSKQPNIPFVTRALWLSAPQVCSSVLSFNSVMPTSMRPWEA